MSLSPNLRGALLMMGSMAGFTFNDAFVKQAAEQMPLFQIVFLRGVLTVGMTFALAWALGLRRFSIPRQDRGAVLWRSGLEVAAMVAFLTALLNMPLANVTAVLAALPLTVTLAGAVFLKEPVGWRRLSAILVGFVGVLLIVQPGGAGFNAYSLVALLAVAIVTARDLVTRKFSDEVPSLLVAVITALAITGFGGVMSLTEDWVAMDLRLMSLVFGAAVFLIGAYLFSIMVMRVGDIGFIAPFRYTSLIWALLLGWLMFGDWPDRLTQIGALIVVATGVFTLYRERKAALGDPAN